MKIAASIATLSIACALLASPAAAQGNAERGAKLAYTCQGCHGIEGYRNAYPSYRVPKLGGQKAGYLVIALQGYRSGERSHPTMQAHATSLSDQQIDDIAAYLASLSGIAAGGGEATPPQAAAACAACHGPNGVSANPQWPTLAGQYESYIEHALHQYRSGARANAIMGAQAALIAEQDVPMLARYFARLKGLETTKAE